MKGLSKAQVAVPLREEGGALRWVVREDPGLEQTLWSLSDPERRAEARLRAAADAALRGPEASPKEEGLAPALPGGTRIDEVRVRGDQGGFFVTLPAEMLTDFTPERAQYLSDLFRGIDFNAPAVRRHVLMIRDPADGRHHPLDHFLPAPEPVPRKPGEEVVEERLERTGQPPAQGQGRPQGYLSGKSIFVNPGHGWYYNSSLGRWATQRGNTHNIIEDLSNAEAVDTYLVHYLWNAGAGVYTCRERDVNPDKAVVDNGGDGYSETGSWTTATHSGAFGGTYRRAVAEGAETAAATFTPTIPEAGFYHVSVWYVGSSSNVDDARITVRHTGGETAVTRNMEVDGYTWTYLGLFHFGAGASASAGSVVVSNLSAEAGDWVVADAVRFGGGTGAETPFGEPWGSGRPRFEEAGPYHAAYMGCDTCGSSTVTAMPRYAAWENESWEDSVYVSWHTNAPDPGTGTSSFAYASGGWDYPFNGVPGSLELRDSIHDELINDIRAGYDPGWVNRGTHTNWYGEVNPSYNNEMPGSLHEMAFHDTYSDALDLQNPVFRMIVARAVYQGIVKYFAERDGDPGYTLLPEPPENLRVARNGSGTVTLAWDAPPSDSGDGLLGDPAAGYRVYRSADGLGFADGVDVSGGGTTTYTDASVPAGTVAYYRVTAVNAGGESFPTETLAVRVSVGETGILLVSGFDRMDHGLVVVEDDPNSTEPLHRGFVDRMNSYRYVIPYAGALAACGAAFDSCSDEAVTEGQVSLSGYGTVIWYCGEESTADRTFDAAAQALLQSFLAGGGNLFASGSEIGWDLDYRGNGPSFYNNYLKADYAGDDAGTYDVFPAPGGIFDGNASFSFDDGSHGGYDAQYPDQLTPLGGATACLTYSGGLGGTAGIQFDAGPFRLVHFGFPFETVTAASARSAIMADILDFFGGAAPNPCGGAAEVSSFPFTHSGDTTGGPRSMDAYSCAPATNEAGPEVFYRLIVDQPGDLGVTVTDGPGVDIDPHLLSACSPDACLERHDTAFTVNVPPGEYILVCDTWVNGSIEYPGPYTLTVTFTPTPGDTTSPAPVTDSLLWSAGNARWEWEAVAQDRLGNAEAGCLYRVRRTEDPGGEWDLHAVASAPTWEGDPEEPGGCWFYEVEAADAAGNLEDPSWDTIADNPEASFSGTWSTGTSAPGHWGDDYRFIATGGSGAATASWPFAVRERGLYEVRVYYPEGSNRSPGARFIVSHAGGSTLHSVDQTTGGGAWNTLGTHWLESDGTYPVVLDDAEPAGDVVIADAVRWVKP